MTAPHIVDPVGLLGEALAEAWLSVFAHYHFGTSWSLRPSTLRMTLDRSDSSMSRMSVVSSRFGSVRIRVEGSHPLSCSKKAP